MFIYHRVMWVKQGHKPSPKSPQIYIYIYRRYKPLSNGCFIIVLPTLMGFNEQQMVTIYAL